MSTPAAAVPSGEVAECVNCGQQIQRCHDGCRWRHFRNGFFEDRCFVTTFAEPKDGTIQPRTPAAVATTERRSP